MLYEITIYWSCECWQRYLVMLCPSETRLKAFVCRVTLSNKGKLLDINDYVVTDT